MAKIRVSQSIMRDVFKRLKLHFGFSAILFNYTVQSDFEGIAVYTSFALVGQWVIS